MLSVNLPNKVNFLTFGLLIVVFLSSKVVGVTWGLGDHPENRLTCM